MKEKSFQLMREALDQMPCSERTREILENLLREIHAIERDSDVSDYDRAYAQGYEAGRSRTPTGVPAPGHELPNDDAPTEAQQAYARGYNEGIGAGTAGYTNATQALKASGKDAVRKERVRLRQDLRRVLRKQAESEIQALMSELDVQEGGR